MICLSDAILVGFLLCCFFKGGHQCTKRENYTEENWWIKQSIRSSSQLITVNEKSDKLLSSFIDLLSQIEINFSQLVKYVHIGCVRPAMLVAFSLRSTCSICHCKCSRRQVLYIGLFIRYFFNFFN